MRIFTLINKFKQLIFIIVILFFQNKIIAQKKLYIDVNLGVLHSIGSDITKSRKSDIQPLTVYYYSRKRFEQPYINILGNFIYPITYNILLGLQTGIYSHFNEHYFGITKSMTVSIPIMATFRANVLKANSKTIGINLSAGKTFFDIKSGIMELKNGVLFNESIFLVKKKSIWKLGLDQEIQNEFLYFTADNPQSKSETFVFHLNRLSVVLSYVILKFF